MSQDRKEIRIEIVKQPPRSIMPEPYLMACRRCGASMVRGTQCKRCGARCR